MASETPRQYAGHLFAGTPPTDETCQACGAAYADVVAAHGRGGIAESVCPHFGPQHPVARKAFFAQQAERDRHANIAHGGQS